MMKLFHRRYFTIQHHLCLGIQFRFVQYFYGYSFYVRREEEEFLIDFDWDTGEKWSEREEREKSEREMEDSGGRREENEWRVKYDKIR